MQVHILRRLACERGMIWKATLFYGTMSDLCPRVLLKNGKAKPEVMPLGVKQESVSPILKEQLNYKHKDLLFT